jgi:hypothetical protein
MIGSKVDLFFSEQVFNIFFKSVQRSINHARSNPGEEGILAALGLLCYTEALGKYVLSGKRGTCTATFNAFFDRLGREYKMFRESLPLGQVYGLLRCGLVHEGTTKKPCRIRTLKGPESCGVWKDSPGKGYVFSVEKYFEDFQNASFNLYKELMAQGRR